MRLPGLLASIFALLLPLAPARAQEEAGAGAPARAAALLERLGAIVAPLPRGAHTEQERRPVAGLLSRLRVEAAALKPPSGAPARAEAWLKLERGVEIALREEDAFWKGRTGGPLAPASAEPLRRRVAELSAAYSALFPERAPGAAPHTGADAPDRGPSTAALADRGARIAASGRGATGDARLFYDGGATRTGTAASAQGSVSADRPGGAPSRRVAFTAPARSHPTDLALGPVPPPATSSETACRQASGGGRIAGLCGSKAAWSAPLVAGLVDAAKEQFGTVSGAVSLLAFTALGLLLSALSGGVGLLATLIKALCGVALVWTAASMIRRIAAALAVFLSTRDDDPRRWRALREIGKVGGELIIIMMMAFVGYKIGQKPAVKDAAASMTRSLQGQMSRLGLRPAAPPAEAAAALAVPAAAPPRMAAAGNRSNLRPPQPPPQTASPAVRPAGRVPAPPAVRLAKIAEIEFPRPQLQHEFRHAPDFGITGSQSNRTLAQFQQAIMAHMEAVPRGIPGKFRQTVEVVHFTDPRTGLNVMLRPNGEFFGAWKLNPLQLQNVLSRSSL